MEKSTYYKPEEKTWYTALLFKEVPKHLGNNKARATAILSQVEKSAIKNNHVAEVNEAYLDTHKGGFAESVPDQEIDCPDGSVHYLPCHPVYKTDKVSTRCRIVMNAASKTPGGSLNDFLYTGPNLLPDIVQVLIRFRMNFVAFVLDISKMFLRIKLQEGKDFLRFLWRDCDQTIPPKIWRMICIVFGVVSSPFQAIFVVLKHAEMFKRMYQLAQRCIQDNMYMDDTLDCATSKEEAEEIVTQIYKLLLEASMTPHKFASNDQSILKAIPKELWSQEPTVKVLGIQWCTTNDTLLFNFTDKMEPEKTDTKRSLLQQSASIFDPCGLISPITTTIKIVFQELWLSKLSWDDKLPQGIQEKFNEWKNSIKEINDLSKNRCFFDKSKGTPEKIELLAFGDSSEKAYAATIYIKGTYKDKSSSVELVFSKTRVSPIKMIEFGISSETIVRLELLAALITARALNYVKKALENRFTIAKTHCFTDSMINLQRLRRGPEKYKVWVGHRLAEILRLTNKSDWKHIPGINNPADLPSRGISAKELKESKLWWHGPEFVQHDESTWPDEIPSNTSPDTEVKKIFPTSSATQQDNTTFLDIFNRFSSWKKTIDTFSYILRFGNKTHKQFSGKPLSIQEKKLTENFLLRTAQKTGFPDEFKALSSGETPNLKHSDIRDYNPTWDTSKELIISNSRLTQSDLDESTKKPTLLPKNSTIVDKLVLHIHETHGHSGPGYTLAMTRQKYRICQARRQIQSIIKKCTVRHCTTPRKLTQQMNSLPHLRTDNPGAFRNTSVDLFGPMYAKHWCKFENCPHPTENKVYGALFTCFHSRAVHIELIRDQGTEEFLNAFRSFIGRRGTPDYMFSDNATNFKASCKEIRNLYKSINWKAVKEDGRTKTIEWFFNTELAPWANGLCERMVRSVKTPLRKIVGSAKLTFRQLSVILTEVEGMVNNRPLSSVTDHPDDLTPITPAELIIGRRMCQLPDPNPQKSTTPINHLWKKRQHTLNAFWKRWNHDYLLEQNVRKKWPAPSEENLLNKIVLIRDDTLSRNVWKMGKIVDTVKSKDNLVRTVLVKTPTSILRRPIQRISLLENVL
jgi:hypothetical protein